MPSTTLGKQDDLSLVIDEELALELVESQVDKGDVLANRLEDISVHLKQLNHLNQYMQLTEELNEHKKNDASPSTSKGCPITHMQRPIRLKNIEGKPEVYDKLHLKGQEVNKSVKILKKIITPSKTPPCFKIAYISESLTKIQ